MSSPFVSDTVERAVKTFIGGSAGFAMSDLVGHFHALHWDEKAVLWAGATTACSVLMSLASRRFGQPGTASVSHRVAYDDAT